MTDTMPRSPARPTPRAGDVRLPDGVRLHYLEQGDPAGPAVILLHGYSDSSFSFSRVLPLLPATLHALALDQRGHGDSDRPRTGYAMHELAADVLAFMDARGIERATIAGHSMGGLVAQQVAQAAPQRVQRLVLIDTTAHVRTFAGIDELERAVAALADPVPVAFTREFQESTVHRPVPEPFMARAVAESGKLPARVWRAIMDGMLEAEPATGLAEAGIPTLVLWGDRDAYCPRSEQEALLRLIPTAALTVYPETGHASHWERPEEVARDLAGFVAGR